MKAIKVTIKIDNVDEWSVDWSNKSKTLSELMELNDDIRKALAHHCGLNYGSMTIDSQIIDNQ